MLVRISLTVCGAATMVAAVLPACAQSIEQRAVWHAGGGAAFSTAVAQPVLASAGKPIARLIRNPDPNGGLPPFALTDQAGTIQRYVEPVPEVDLAAYVGEIVVVRHDTGRTLLASQLELPPLALQAPPLDTANFHIPANSAEHFQPVQYTDDDLTVELLSEDNSAAQPSREPPDADPGVLAFPTQEHPLPLSGSTPPFNEYPQWDAPYGDPQACGTADFAYGANGSYSTTPDAYRGGWGLGLPVDPHRQTQMRIYGQVEINFLRVHLTEEPLGKLSEKYEFSPRFVVGFTDLGPLDGRVRYWIYGRETRRLPGGSIRLEFDVLDLETTHYVGGRRSEVLLAAGVRFAHLEFEDVNGAAAGSDQVGLTFAADGRTRIQRLEQGRVSWIYGGRLSILAGNWGGDNDHEFINRRIRDDNTVVHELYVGLEYAGSYQGLDVLAQAAFEMQNWHSNTFDAAGIESISLLGPGVRLGARF
jgi:hypothetical protein